MKHGLKQEIKRGLSVLMAVSMVAGSALPVMAEEVVEEAVEVEVVSEEVADAEEDVVVDVVEDAEIVEEVVEDAADVVVGDYDGPVVDADSDHAFVATETSKYRLAVYRSYYENQTNNKFVIHYSCGRPGCTVPEHAVEKTVEGTLPTKVGKKNGESVTINDNMKMVVYLENKVTMDCETNTEGYEKYVLASVNNDFDTKTEHATDEVIIPVEHEPGKSFVVEEYGTCTKAAKVSYNCKKCGKKLENVSIPAPGHDYKVSYTNTNKLLWADDGTSLTIHVDCTQPEQYTDNMAAYNKCFKGCEFSKDVTFTGDQIREKNYEAPTCVAPGSVWKYMEVEHQKKALESMIDYNPLRDADIKNVEKQAKKFAVKALGHLNVKLTEVTTASNINIPQYGDGITWNGCYWTNVSYECERCGKHDVTWDGSYNKGDDEWTSSDKDKCTVIINEISAPDCMNDGKAELSIRCKLSDGSIIAGSKKMGAVSKSKGYHKYSAADAAKATCAKPYKGAWECTVCGHTINNEPIYAEHSIVLTSNVIEKATCLKQGIKEGYCTVCKKYYTEMVTDFKTKLKAGDTTAFGKVQLNRLYDTLKTDCIIPKLQHEYSIINEAWDDGTWTTLTAKCNNGCENEYTQTLPVEIVYDKYPTYDQEGTRHYTATMVFDVDRQHIVLPWTSNKVTVKATEVPDEVTLSIANKTVEYTGDRQRVNVAASVVDGGNNVIANVAKEVVVKYYKDPAYTQQFSGEPYTAGTYYVKATLEATKSHKGKTAEAVLVINKKNPTVTVKQSATTVKNTKKNKVNITVSIKDVIGQKGKVTYVADKGITVSKKGIVTIKKGTKKGTYKIKINVAETPNYNGVPREIKIKVK